MSITVEKAKVVDLLFEAVDEVNQQLKKEQRLDKSLELALTGTGGRLDSLGMLNLIVHTEQRIDSVFGVSVMLADDEALAKDPSPFRTLGSFAEHIQAVVEKNLNPS
jgi:acyl carrier protein